MFWNTSLDPYWSPPEEEEARTARVKEGLVREVKTLDNILFFVIKSWNDNIVLYEYDENSSETIKTCWLSIQKEDADRHRRNGNMTLRNGLNPAEELLFGCELEIVEGNRFILKLKQEQLANKTFEIVCDSLGKPAVIGAVNGIMCRVEHAYVHMKKGMVPEPEFMNFYGRSLKDGSIVKEKIVSK